MKSEEVDEVVLIILFCTVSHVCIFHSFSFGETVESWDCGNISCMVLLMSYAASTFTAGLSPVAWNHVFSSLKAKELGDFLCFVLIFF